MRCAVFLCAVACGSVTALQIRPEVGHKVDTLRRQLLVLPGVAGVAALAPLVASARPEGVNKPELLPPKRADGSVPTVVDVGVNFLTKGEQKRLESIIAKLERDSGVRLRVLCQRYPETPGLAIRDYWNVDDNTVVLVADKGSKGTSNILNFNVGSAVDEPLPTIFWSRLQSRYGTSRYWRDNGEDVAILNAVESIAVCAKDGCLEPPNETALGKL